MILKTATILKKRLKTTSPIEISDRGVCRGSAARSPRAAFSVIELLVVLFIIALVTGMSAVFFQKFAGSSALETAARQVETVLIQARGSAISTQRRHRVVFNAAAHSYEVQEEIAAGTFQTRAAYVLPQKNIGGAVRQVVLFSPAAADPITFISDMVTFSPSGSANGGSVYLADRDGREYTLTVITATGRTEVYNHHH
ncbi:MAG: GspH/FimT family pseudopilin [Candidatus Omnitrophica bacterium]|nr:GspH/FimT family pseudopilin [Candidatus Omnitrophota bacterium]